MNQQNKRTNVGAHDVPPFRRHESERIVRGVLFARSVQILFMRLLFAESTFEALDVVILILYLWTVHLRQQVLHLL